MNSGYVLECRHTHITGNNNLIPISIPLHVYATYDKGYGVSCLKHNYSGKWQGQYRNQIVTCDVGVSLHSKTHPLFVKCAVMAQVQTVRRIPVSKLVSCAFSPIPISPLSIQRIFDLLVSTLFLLVSNKLATCTCNLALGINIYILGQELYAVELHVCFVRKLHNV